MEQPLQLLNKNQHNLEKQAKMAKHFKVKYQSTETVSRGKVCLW